MKPTYHFLFLFLILNMVAFSQEDGTECPYFNISSSDSTSTSATSFSLLSTDIDVTISGVIANIEIEQTYVNNGQDIVDASYVFPMSTNAAVYAMEMEIDQRVIVAEIQRRDVAETIFNEADSLGLTATLLEQERPNVMQMSIANINPDQTIIVRMVYTELLIPEKGNYQFVFPNIVGPRFTQGGEPWVNQNAQDSIPLSETSLNINMKINAGMPLTANCDSHNATFIYNQNTASTNLSTNPGADFIVDYTLSDNEIHTGLLLFEDEEENFFLSMVQPSRPEIPFVSPPREYIFIMDVSGSMNGFPLDVSKELLENLLQDLNDTDKFNIIFFAGGSYQYADASVLATEQNINNAMDAINSQSGGGGTMILPAMRRALDMQIERTYARTFVIVTDGYVTVEKEAFDLIRDNLNESNFFAFGIGKSVNRYIIEGIAYVGEGDAFVATDQSEAIEIAEKFKEYIERPAVTNIEATFEGIDVYDVEPLSIPDLFAERPIILYGKYREPANGKITVAGEYPDGIISNTLEFEDYQDNLEENIALKYLWARKKIRLMSDYGIASNENDTISIEEEITQLGLKYNLVTEFTSFVAVDSSVVFGGGGTDEPYDEDGTVVVDLDKIAGKTEIIDKEIIILRNTILSSNDLLRLGLINTPLYNEEFEIQVANLQGRIIASQKVLSTQAEYISVPISNLSAGIYFVSVVSKGGKVLDTEQFTVIN